MNDDRRSEIRTHYLGLMEMQRKLRVIVAQGELTVDLRQNLREPSTVEQLSDLMNEVRANMLAVQVALNELDRLRNGCETRTRALIMLDIDRDEALLAKGSFDGDRLRPEIEGNVAYDRMQLCRV